MPPSWRRPEKALEGNQGLAMSLGPIWKAQASIEASTVLFNTSTTSRLDRLVSHAETHQKASDIDSSQSICFRA